MKSFSFASYGTPTGSCGSFQPGTCHRDIRSILSQTCLNQRTCHISVSNDSMGGDPCPHLQKTAAVQVVCDAGVPSPAPSVSNTPTPQPTMMPSATPTPTAVPTVAPAPTVTAAPSTPPAAGASTALSFSVIPYTDPDIVSPGRGAELWNYVDQAIDHPVSGNGFSTMDYYFRFAWTHFENETQGVYDWTLFDSKINEAIRNKQKFGFGIMQVAWDTMNYPAYLHRLMQAEATRDINIGGRWFPNWNSPTYLDRLDALHRAINQHIENGSYLGVRYKDVINYIDIRGYGEWGEWHTPGIFATSATLRRIIDSHVNGFPDHQLAVIISIFDADRLQNTRVPAEIGTYALTVRNRRGKLGWRRDNWSANDAYIPMWLEQSSSVDGNLPDEDKILNRWKIAPILGEPYNGGVGATGSSCAYELFEAQARRYHASMVGNGNYVGNAGTACALNNLRNAFKAMGYRIVLNGGSRTTQVSTSDRKLTVALNWRNVGISPTYEDWNVMLRLKNSSGAVVWSGRSSHVMRLFLPASTDTVVTDTFVLPTSVPTGQYSLSLSIDDPKNYRSPMPIAIQGRQANGSYDLGNVSVP